MGVWLKSNLAHLRLFAMGAVFLFLLIACSQQETPSPAAKGAEKAQLEQATTQSAQDAELDLNFDLAAKARAEEEAAHIKEISEKAASGDQNARFELGYRHQLGRGVPLDYEKALSILKPLADGGDAKSIYVLALMYDEGRGVEKNPNLAQEYFEKAYHALQADKVEAQLFLGRMYLYGQFAERDYVQALEWFEKSAQGGDPDAQYYLAYMKFHGMGTIQDKVAAFESCRKAADRGVADAQYLIGYMNEFGMGTTQSDALALKWYAAAVKQDNMNAQFRLGFRQREEKNYPGAIKWFTLAAQQGDVRAQVELGEMFAQGEGCAKDMAAAVEWFQKAADQGNPIAQLNIGAMYQFGQGLPQDSLRAIEWFSKSAEQGNIEAQYNLGYMFENGQGGIQIDGVTASKWYTMAAEQGYAPAQYRLGGIYAKGKIVTLDGGKAAECYTRAALQGHIEAQHSLSELYSKGESLTQDYIRACAWLNVALALDDTVASKIRQSLVVFMTPDQIAAAQVLGQELVEKIKANENVNKNELDKVTSESIPVPET